MNLENFVRGTDLHPEDQKHVLAAYIYRYTREYVPAWATKPNGETYPVQFASDADWLANTTFAVKTDGRLDKRVNRCESNPTWPDHPELRKP